MINFSNNNLVIPLCIGLLLASIFIDVLSSFSIAIFSVSLQTTTYPKIHDILPVSYTTMFVAGLNLLKLSLYVASLKLLLLAIGILEHAEIEQKSEYTYNDTRNG